ncbi:MAG: hypothetical protein H0T78_10535 [Longispora sp.]|nr:hypothetical protein [Longispora sp. (in: high G+C Gram-positive bacteria)]
MIVKNLWLILAAAVLNVAGLALASNWLLAAAILACVSAAMLVYAGSRRPEPIPAPSRVDAPVRTRVPVAVPDRAPDVLVADRFSPSTLDRR